MNLLWTPHNLASVCVLRAQIPTPPANARPVPAHAPCQDRVLDGPTSGEKGSKGGPYCHGTHGFHTPHYSRGLWARFTLYSSLERSPQLNIHPIGTYRGTSLVRNRHPVGPYNRPMPRLLWRS